MNLSALPVALGNRRVSGRIHASQLSCCFVGIDRAASEGTVRYWLEPLKTAALSPLGIVPMDGVPPT